MLRRLRRNRWSPSRFVRQGPSSWLTQIVFTEMLTAIIVGLLFFAVTEYRENERQETAERLEDLRQLRAERLENLRFVRSAVANPLTEVHDSSRTSTSLARL